MHLDSSGTTAQESLGRDNPQPSSHLLQQPRDTCRPCQTGPQCRRTLSLSSSAESPVPWEHWESTWATSQSPWNVWDAVARFCWQYSDGSQRSFCMLLVAVWLTLGGHLSHPSCTQRDEEERWRGAKRWTFRWRLPMQCSSSPRFLRDLEFPTHQTLPEDYVQLPLSIDGLIGVIYERRYEMRPNGLFNRLEGSHYGPRRGHPL